MGKDGLPKNKSLHFCTAPKGGINDTQLQVFSLSLCFRHKDETSSTGCVYSVLVSRVVGTVPAFGVRQVLFHIEGTFHQMKVVPSSSTVLVLVVSGLGGS